MSDSPSNRTTPAVARRRALTVASYAYICIGIMSGAIGIWLAAAARGALPMLVVAGIFLLFGAARIVLAADRLRRLRRPG